MEGGESWLPPFTIQVERVWHAPLLSGRAGSPRDAPAEYEVIATVVDEMRGSRKLHDRLPLSPELAAGVALAGSPTKGSPNKGSTNKGSPRSPGPSALQLLAAETTTSLDHAYQTVTEPRLGDDGSTGLGGTTVTWGEGGFLTIVGARTTSLVVLTLMRKASVRDPTNPNHVSSPFSIICVFSFILCFHVSLPPSHHHHLLPHLLLAFTFRAIGFPFNFFV